MEEEQAKPVAEGLLLTKMYRDFFQLPASQQIFLVMIVGIVPALIPFLYSFNEIVQLRKDGNPSYPWPEYDDLLTALYTCIVLLVLKNYVERLAPMAEPLISAKYQGQIRKERSKRFVYCMFKGLYFALAVAAGFYVLRDADFMPPQLGGTGLIENVFKNFPYQPTDKFPFARMFMMVELGYHMHSLADLLMHKSRSDFIEMLLHHLSTCFLIGLSYFMNYVAISSLILIIHDISDVFVCFTRALVDTPYTAICMTMAVGMYSTFAYYRLYFFPCYLIYYGYYQNPAGSNQIYGLHVLGAMVHFLMALHIYWFTLISFMFLRFFKFGVREDIQQKLAPVKKAN